MIANQTTLGRPDDSLILPGGGLPNLAETLTTEATVTLDPLLDFIMNQLETRVDYDSGAVMLGVGSSLMTLSVRGELPQKSVTNWWLHSGENPIYHELVRRRKPLIIPDIEAGTGPAADFRLAVGEEFDSLRRYGHSWLGIPLVIREQFMGILWLLHHRPGYYTLYHARLALPFARQMAVALEHHQLYQHLHQQAILQERGRLAREIHDQLAQALACINLKTSIVSELLAAGQATAAQTGMAELKQLVEESYDDVRQEIFNLRTSLAAPDQFLPTLRKYLEEYETVYELPAQLLLHDEALVRFSPLVTSQLIRIIQEALTNVRKHAQATQVMISFWRETDKICLSIRDDGQGFEPPRERDEEKIHFGLNIMRERAESVGGRLEIHSQPGEGTEIRVRLPDR